MGEYVWVSYTIGGKAPTKVIEEELIAAVEEHFPAGDHCLSVEKLIDEALRNGTSVTFQGECNFGNAESLDAFCLEHSLSYHRSWAAQSGQFDAGLEYWHPGMAGPVEESANDDGEPMANLSWLQSQLKEGADLAGVIAELGRASASTVPPLQADDLISRLEAVA